MEETPEFISYPTGDALEWKRTKDKPTDYVSREPDEESMDYQGFRQSSGRDQGGNRW